MCKLNNHVMHEEMRVTIQNYVLSKFFFQKKNLHLTWKFPKKFSGLCFETFVPGKYNCQLYKLTLYQHWASTCLTPIPHCVSWVIFRLLRYFYPTLYKYLVFISLSDKPSKYGIKAPPRYNPNDRRYHVNIDRQVLQSSLDSSHVRNET